MLDVFRPAQCLKKLPRPLFGPLQIRECITPKLNLLVRAYSASLDAFGHK